LDANTQNGVALTNVAGAIQWFNGDSSNPERVAYDRVLTNGTVGIAGPRGRPHRDDVALTGFFFEKTVAEPDQRGEPRDGGGAGRRAALHPALPHHRPGPPEFPDRRRPGAR
jgi:hypothetical protein